ncbi:uncharacterized protein YbgA (DUF1722 family) [Pseudomonas duriflava]|uniref:Uncharacterized protein YbgA (DUF1722 family) n=1 Tax=Pseudomonas duriflava TaxID=459528 RepID=A0A562QDT4_9PSED|nr:DUF523 and DUF1722 domain-containing protein [Pseudomonas duriflava]TWI54908.1 uncharacterized protein YbgA (DUF1722 family) [Pseudomonas duriflava]
MPLRQFATLTRPKLGISACLLGEPVRYNGGHKESRLCSRTLSEHFDFVPVCPEMAIGLGTPREPIRLVGSPERPRAVGSVDSSLDVTEALQAYGARMAHELNDLSGFILMQKSPSCGMERVKVYSENGMPSQPEGVGLFARAFCEQRPELPVEEAGRLNDPILRENFVTRVFAYAQWQELLQQGLTYKAILGFHSRYKYQLMAHHPEQFKELGRLLGNIGSHDPNELGRKYFKGVMVALKRCATRGNHCNVLYHLFGYLRKSLSAADKQEMQHLIEQYHKGIVPLVVPLTLLKHHFRRHPDHYVAEQSYMQPHPEDLSLRNAI